jgi:hypothetical protein
MHKLLPVLVFLAAASVLCQRSAAVELPFAADVSGAGNAVVLVGGMGGGAMGGMTGGGMGGGMTGGGMGGMTPGGMSGGMGGMSGGMNGCGAAPDNGSGSTYGERIRAAAARSLRNTSCASRLTIAARWHPPPAPSAAVHHALVPPDIAARSNRGKVSSRDPSCRFC